MSLNIKNPRVHELAREAARRGGTSQTHAIEHALELYLAWLDEPHQSRLELILQDFDETLTGADRAAMSTEILYDEAGLPR